MLRTTFTKKELPTIVHPSIIPSTEICKAFSLHFINMQNGQLS